MIILQGMSKIETNPGGVKSTETSMEIIEYLAHNGEGRITQIADDLGIAKSTVHRHLHTLRNHRLIDKEGDLYHLGLGFLKLGELSRSRKDAYREAGKTVQKLAETTGERAQFVVEEQGYGVYLHGACGDKGVKTNPRLGKRLPLHATSTGKAILAHLPAHYVDQVIEEGLEKVTKHTITDKDRLREELEQIRDRGYSINNQENIIGLRALGVPVKRPNGTLIGALSVSGPVQRFQGEWYEETVPELLLEVANELEINIEHIRED